MTLAYVDSRSISWTSTSSDDSIARQEENISKLFLEPDTNFEYATVDQSIPPMGYHEGIPASILYRYSRLVAKHAHCEEIAASQWIATVVGIEGAYGEGATKEEAHIDLIEAIAGWVVVKRRIGAADIPVIDDLDLNSVERHDSGEVSTVNETA